jgi:hypothetical protein
MSRGLSDSQIERAIRQLLARHHRVTVRDVMQALRSQFGGCGRTERICKIFKRLESQERPILSAGVDDQIQILHERLRAAEARAALSEERERQHQDLWASRYADKVAALERQQSRATARAPGITHEQYLRVYQRAAELARRLAKYEDPDKPSTGEND